MKTIDINSDLAEGYGVAYTAGDDDAMLSIVTSANVACGFHAGDPEIMARTFKTAKERGVAIGAHPGFPDLWGFGRRRLPYSLPEIERIIAYQLGAAQALATYSGHRITFVKGHGAIGNMTEVDRSVADAVVRAVKAVDPSLIMLTIARSKQVEAAEGAGLHFISEIYADRGYGPDGTMIPRGQPGALIADPKEAADRVVAMATENAVIAVDGTRLPTEVRSVCVHGDSPHAVGTARLIRQRLEAAGFTVAPFSPV
ncbi:MAG: LamB/YcsF family protein [Variibacter sp.]